MERTQAGLEELVAAELWVPAPEAARVLADEIRARHGHAVAAVLFYGSCLRKQTDEGVLDFYVLVDDYASAYSSRWLARANALLPPNVFYLEAETPGGTARCKYAVVSLRDFARGAGPKAIRPAIWARFCQPALAVWTRDEAARRAVLDATVRAVCTATLRALEVLPDEAGLQRFSSEELWLALFEETYGGELRPESADTIRSLHHAAPERYARVLRAALAVLADADELRLHGDGEKLSATRPADRLRRGRRARRVRRPAAKLVGVAQLLKSAVTFGDWLPYALWKLERHTGTRLEPSERQRRHPFVFAWPLLFHVLRRRELR
ncbi:MAG: hypothetical protein JSU66_08875 [Deltaproteobacteria bacterium]|nr:MAG: hypothetical protein JSU66_08875 [Deltaproteobacteria bacterium]